MLFFVCILGTFIYGMYIGGGRVVYASTAHVIFTQFLERWQYICQVGVGLAGLPALVQRERMQDGKSRSIERQIHAAAAQSAAADSEPLRDRPMTRAMSSSHPDELAKWNYDLGDYFELGTVFT